MSAAPPSNPYAVTVSCWRCYGPVVLDRDVLRAMVDDPAQPSPECGERCPGRPRPSRAKPKPVRRWSKADRVLLAVSMLARASSLGHAGQSVIVVTAWQADRAAFGLPDFAEQYPHSNAVVVCLVNLVAWGLVERPAPGRYRLTEAGRKRAAELTRTTEGVASCS